MTKTAKEKEFERRFERIESNIESIIGILKDGKTTARDIPMFYEYLDLWLTETKAPKITAKSLKILASGVNNYIKPNIENKPLDKIKASEMLIAIDKVPYSYMRQVVYSIFRAVFKRAYQFDMIRENPAEKLDFVKHVRQKGKALTKNEQAEFIKAISKDEKYCPLWLFYLLSGCRCSEILAIKWTDVDNEQKRIFIRGTKTESAERYIPLFPQIAEILKELPQTSEYIFPFTQRAIQWNFDKIREKNGFKFRIHDLRHTFATRCLESGISLNTVQKWLGHKSSVTTAGIYQHVLTDFEKEEAKRFNPKI